MEKTADFILVQHTTIDTLQKVKKKLPFHKVPNPSIVMERLEEGNSVVESGAKTAGIIAHL